MSSHLYLDLRPKNPIGTQMEPIRSFTLAPKSIDLLLDLADTGEDNIPRTKQLWAAAFLKEFNFNPLITHSPLHPAAAPAGNLELFNCQGIRLDVHLLHINEIDDSNLDKPVKCPPMTDFQQISSEHVFNKLQFGNEIRIQVFDCSTGHLETDWDVGRLRKYFLLYFFQRTRVRHGLNEFGLFITLSDHERCEFRS